LEKVKVGLLTISQSPREDIVPEIAPLFHPCLEILEKGLLDNLSPEEIARFQPDTGETPLVSRLRDGSQVELSKKKISFLLPEVIRSMQKEMKTGAVGVLCTDNFPRREFPIPVVFPFDYLDFLVNRVLNARRLGVVIPLKSQVEMAKKKWEKEKVIVEAKSPYTEGKSWGEIAKKFVAEKVDAVILDCIGYKIRDRQEIQKLISLPTLLPRLILVSAINQLFSKKGEKKGKVDFFKEGINN